jgi:hypothetical protein
MVVRIFGMQQHCHHMNVIKLEDNKTYTIQQMQVDDVERYKKLRLEALSTEPGVFGNSYATEAAYPEEVWRDRMTNSYGACFWGVLRQ